MGAGQQILVAAAGVAPFTPSDIADIWEWWEPSREVGLNDSDPLTPLNGQLNNRDWEQGAAGASPLYKTNVLNGLAVVDVTGATGRWYATGPDMSALTAFHCFMVVQAANDPATDIGQTGLSDMGATATSATHYPFTDSNIYEAAFTTARKTLGNPAAALTGWRVYELVSVSGEYTAKLDGTQIFTTGTNTVSARSNPRLFINDDNNSSKAKIAGMYLFSAKLSAGNRTDLISYINSRFALSSS